MGSYGQLWAKHFRGQLWAAMGSYGQLLAKRFRGYCCRNALLRTRLALRNGFQGPCEHALRLSGTLRLSATRRWSCFCCCCCSSCCSCCSCCCCCPCCTACWMDAKNMTSKTSPEGPKGSRGDPWGIFRRAELEFGHWKLRRREHPGNSKTCCFLIVSKN